MRRPSGHRPHARSAGTTPCRAASRASRASTAGICPVGGSVQCGSSVGGEGAGRLRSRPRTTGARSVLAPGWPAPRSAGPAADQFVVHRGPAGDGHRLTGAGVAARGRGTTTVRVAGGLSTPDPGSWRTCCFCVSPDARPVASSSDPSGTSSTSVVSSVVLAGYGRRPGRSDLEELLLLVGQHLRRWQPPGVGDLVEVLLHPVELVAREVPSFCMVSSSWRAARRALRTRHPPVLGLARTP